MRNADRGRGLARLVVWVCLVSAAILAFEGAAAAEPERPDTPSFELEPTTVEAERDQGYVAASSASGTKTDTPLFDLPVSVQVVPPRLLEDRQVIRLEDAVETVSGAYRTSVTGIGEDAYVLRGFEQFTRYEDGFRVPGFGTFQETAHVDRVEVLKGPASVLYGRSEPGGVINLVTKRPLPAPAYSLQQLVGSDDLYRTVGDLTGPVAGGLRYRLVFTYEDAGSFRDHVESEQLFVAPMLSWSLGPKTEIGADYQHQDRDVVQDLGILVEDGEPLLPIERFLGEPDVSDATIRYDQARFFAHHELAPGWTVHPRFVARWSELDEIAVTPDELLPDGRTLVRGAFDLDEEIRTLYGTLDVNGRFATGPIGHNILVGFDALNYRQTGGFVSAAYPSLDAFEPVYTNPEPVFEEGVPGFVDRAEWYGIYFQDQIDVFEWLKILGGGRYDWARTSSRASDFSFGNRTDDERFSPRVGVVLQPLRWLALYASFVESLGNTNFGRSRTGQAFDPQIGEQYEAGVKTELLDGRVSTTLAYYKVTKENVLATDPADPEFSIQLGEVESEGVELDVSGELTEGWSVVASYAYTDTEIVNDNFTGTAGNDLRAIPDHGGRLWTRYEFLQGALAGLSAGGGIFAVGEREGNNENTFVLDGYERFDCLVAYEWKLGAFRTTAQLNVQNLTDTEYLASTSNSFPGFFAFPGAPRTFLGSLRLEF
jgi:iron complex outermembrane recepter protein